MKPSGRWTAAMARAVSRTSSGSTLDLVGRSPLQVEHQALAEQRVEKVLEAAEEWRAVHDQAHQQPVVGPRGPGVTEQAAQPPVRRVQGVGEVGAGDREP